MKIRALSFSPCVIFKTAERKRTRGGNFVHKVKQSEQIVVLAAGLHVFENNLKFFSCPQQSAHAGFHTVVLLLLLFYACCTRLKLTHRPWKWHTHTERIKTLVINVHFAFYCSFSSKLHFFLKNVLILNKMICIWICRIWKHVFLWEIFPYILYIL